MNSEEFKQIAPMLQAHPDVLEIRWEICAMAKEWDVCVRWFDSLSNFISI